MPFILVVLFAIALLVTLIGLFLSPKSQQRDSHNEYLVTPRGRRVVESMSVPLPRRREFSTGEGRQFTDVSLPSIPARASRGTGAIKVNTGLVVQGPVARNPRANRLQPQYGEELIDRLNDWRVALPGLCALLLLAFYLFGLFFPHQAIWTSVWFGPLNSDSKSAGQSAPTYHASQTLTRLSQLDRAQYRSTQEYNTWAYSACSAASMTEVINSYGHNYRITTILSFEAQIHKITPEDGLLEEAGIELTGKHFHFKTTWGHNLSLTKVIAAANSGTPVIVGFPPYKYAGGHLLVVHGGDSNSVLLADSSIFNRTRLSHAAFLKWWGGFYAIMTPD